MNYQAAVDQMNRNEAAFAKLLIESYKCTGIGNIRKAIDKLLSGLVHGPFCINANIYRSCFKALPSSVANFKEFDKGMAHGIMNGWFLAVS